MSAPEYFKKKKKKKNHLSKKCICRKFIFTKIHVNVQKKI